MAKAPKTSATAAETKKATGTAVAAAAQTSVASYVDDFGNMAGAGMEKVGASDLLIPRIAILQELSPQVKPKKAEYIDGAEIGDICNLGTGDLYEAPFFFLPVYYRKDYLEWAPRSSGKGLVAVHTNPAILDRCIRNEKNQPILPNGNYVAETAQFFGFNLTDGRTERCFIPMASTQLKKGRRWLTMATGERLVRGDGTEFTPPLFYRTYKLGVGDESNNEGEWKGWTIERGDALPELGASIFSHRPGWTHAGLLEDAKQFLDQLIRGEADVDKSHLGETEAAGPTGDDRAM